MASSAMAEGDPEEKRPPKTQRRAREVSSRYMAAVTSPLASSSCSSAVASNFPPLPQNKLPPRRRLQPPVLSASSTDGSSFGDENLSPSHNRLEIDNPKLSDASVRAVGSRFTASKTSRPGTPLEQSAASSVTPRTARDGCNSTRSVVGRTTPRTTSSRASRSLHDSLKGVGQRLPASPSSDYDANSCRSAGSSPERLVSEADNCSVANSEELGFCRSPTIQGKSSHRRWLSSDSESSFHRGVSSSLCNRSLNSALSGCQPRQSQPFPSARQSLKYHTSSSTVESLNGNADLDSKRAKKPSNREEDVHTLRILHNRQLQSMFVNAKAQAVEQARIMASERTFHAVSSQLGELRDSVAAKRVELNLLKKQASVSEVIVSQMPLLSEWASLEGEHSSSLSGAVKSLQDASLRLPVSANVKVDINQIGEALSSATEVLESLAFRVGCILPKVEGMQSVASDLAEVVCEERALTEECGELLALTQALQIKECSLRANLMQIRQSEAIHSTQV
ncbi:uncharacterized protein LOC144704621 [Wolffia australiana]